MHLIVELSISISMTLTSLYKSIWQPLRPCTGGSHCGAFVCVCAPFGFLLYCWHDEGNWSVGLVNQCQHGWADCIWWSCSDQMASWHEGSDWQDVYMYVHLYVFFCVCAARTCVCVCAREGWLAGSSNVLWLFIQHIETQHVCTKMKVQLCAKRFILRWREPACTRICRIQQFSDL